MLLVDHRLIELDLDSAETILVFDDSLDHFVKIFQFIDKDHFR